MTKANDWQGKFALDGLILRVPVDLGDAARSLAGQGHLALTALRMVMLVFYCTLDLSALVLVPLQSFKVITLRSQAKPN